MNMRLIKIKHSFGKSNICKTEKKEKEIKPLGDARPIQVDVRIIASTNQDLWALEKKGAFRKDLIYRLSTHTLTLPPLRERLVDLPLLLDRFVCRR